MALLCDVCGEVPCYGICPMNDPFGGDQALEDVDYRVFAGPDLAGEVCIDTVDADDDYYLAPVVNAVVPAAAVVEPMDSGFDPMDDIPF